MKDYKWIIILNILLLNQCDGFTKKKRRPYINVTEISLTIPEDTTPYVVTEHYETDTEAMEKFLALVLRRLEFSIDEARHKWRYGIEITEFKDKTSEIYRNAEAQSKLYKIKLEEAISFMSDQIEASHIIQYSLISNWFANKIEVDLIQPVGDDTLDIFQAQNKMDLIQEDMMVQFAKLDDIRTDRGCGKLLSDVSYSFNESRNHLIRIGLQMSMMTFCKVAIRHPSAQDIRGPRKTPVYRKKYWRKPRVYTPSPTRKKKKKDDEYSHLLDSISKKASSTSYEEFESSPDVIPDKEDKGKGKQRGKVKQKPKPMKNNKAKGKPNRKN